MKKSLKALLIAISIAGTFCMTCYAADFSNYWYQDGSTWKIHDQSGNTIANAWVCDNAVTVNHNTDTNWYLMDASGNMYEGIIQDQNGDYYLLNPEHNGTYGMMLTANGFTYNGVTYQFNQAHDGTFGKILNTQDIGRSGLKVSQVNTAQMILGVLVVLVVLVEAVVQMLLQTYLPLSNLSQRLRQRINQDGVT